MFDLLIEPTKLLLQTGIESFKKSNELKNLKFAIQDRIQREIKFNEAICDTIAKENDDIIKIALIKSFKTSAFDSVNEGSVPLFLLIDGVFDKTVYSSNPKLKKYIYYLESANSIIDLLDRAYYRLHVAKTLADCGKINSDFGYIKFMLSCLAKDIKNQER